MGTKEPVHLCHHWLGFKNMRTHASTTLSPSSLRQGWFIKRALLFAFALVSVCSLAWAAPQKFKEPAWLCDTLASSLTGKEGVHALHPKSQVQKRALHAVLYALARLPQEVFQHTAFVHDHNHGIHICIPARDAVIPGTEIVPRTEMVLETDGRMFQRSGTTTQFLNDPANPMIVHAGCVQLITDCFESGSPGRTPDQCVAAAKVCPQQSATATVSPAPCCPEMCRTRYQEERQRGADPEEALQVFFDETSCVPGVAECLRGECP